MRGTALSGTGGIWRVLGADGLTYDCSVRGRVKLGGLKLAVGDEVCTTSGLYGRVTALDASSATLEISPGVNVRYDRRAIGIKVTPAQATAPEQTPAPEQGQ